MWELSGNVRKQKCRIMHPSVIAKMFVQNKLSPKTRTKKNIPIRKRELVSLEFVLGWKCLIFRTKKSYRMLYKFIQPVKPSGFFWNHNIWILSQIWDLVSDFWCKNRKRGWLRSPKSHSVALTGGWISKKGEAFLSKFYN